MSGHQDRSLPRRPKQLRVCRVRGHQKTFCLLRLYKHKALVVPSELPESEGVLVDRAALYEIVDPEYGQGLFPADSEQQSINEKTPPSIIDEGPVPPSLPLSILDLDNAIVTEPGPPFRVRCYVRGCPHLLRPPTRADRGDLCPDHHIYCNHSSSVTLAYSDARKNLIVAPDIFSSKVRRSPYKVESHRFGFLNSEDAVSWNVFKSLERARALRLIAEWITGREITQEPRMYLWGLSSFDDRFLPWSLLMAARERFEVGKLPVVRPLSEPDIALYIPGQLLIIIEAKLLSPNTVVYRDQPRRTPQSLTADELLTIYNDPALKILDREKLRNVDRIWQQLYRYLNFAEYMASLDGPNTQPFLASLVRAGHEHESTTEFRRLLRPEYADRFSRFTWETVYSLAGLRYRSLERLQTYMLTKAVGTSSGFHPAFQIDAW